MLLVASNTLVNVAGALKGAYTSHRLLRREC